MTKMQRRTFNAEFKLQVVQMIREQGLSVGDVCRGYCQLAAARSREGRATPRRPTSHGCDAERPGATGPSPGRKGLAARRPLGRRVPVVTTVHEQVGYLIVGRRKTLQVPRRFEPAHDLFSDSGRLVRILCPVVQPLVLPVVQVEPQIPIRRRVAPELVGDQHARNPTVLVHELAHQPPGGMSVRPALHEHVQRGAMLVDRAPQPVLVAVDRDHDFVEVPLVAARWRVRANAPGNGSTELQGPASNRLVGHLDVPRSQHLLDHAQAQWKTEVQPDSVADDLRRKSVPRVRDRLVCGGGRHAAFLLRSTSARPLRPTS